MNLIVSLLLPLQPAGTIALTWDNNYTYDGEETTIESTIDLKTWTAVYSGSDGYCFVPCNQPFELFRAYNQ